MMQMSKQELANSAGNFAGSLMRDGYSNAEIIDALMAEGLKQAESEAIVRQLLKIRADNLRQEAQRNRIKLGALVCAFIFGGMILNVLIDGLGYILMWIACGLAFYTYYNYSKRMKEADRIQFSLGQ